MAFNMELSTGPPENLRSWFPYLSLFLVILPVLIGAVVFHKKLFLIMKKILGKIFFSLVPTSTHKISQIITIPATDVQVFTDLPRLGRGNFSQVFAGRFTYNGVTKNAAIKTIIFKNDPLTPEEQRNRHHSQNTFLVECLTLARIKHRNILTMGGLCISKCLQIDGVNTSAWCLILKLADTNLLTFLNRWHSQLVLGTLLEIAYDIACACKYLTTVRIIHRDISAKNILVNYEKRGQNDNLLFFGKAILADFGLAKETGCQICPQYNSSSTQFPLRHAPYECFPEDPTTTSVRFSHKSDVFSFGVFLWELFTLGKRPFEGFDIEELEHGFHLHVGRPILPLSFEVNLTPELDEMMIGCWEKDPEYRPTFEDICCRFKPLLQKTCPKVGLRLNVEGVESV